MPRHVMGGKLLRYLFPYRSPRQRLPPRQLQFSGKYSREGHVEPTVETWHLYGHQVARTHADAHRLLEKHAGKSLIHIVKKERRRRQYKNRFYLAFLRYRRLMRRVVSMFFWDIGG